MSQTTTRSDFSDLYTPIGRYQGNGSTLNFDLSEEVPEGDTRLAVTIDGQEIQSSLYTLMQKTGSSGKISYINFTTAPQNDSYIVIFRRVLAKTLQNVSPETLVYNRYIGNGTGSVFAFTFTIQNQKDIAVFIDGSEGQQSYAFEKTDTGGRITFDQPPQNGQEILILRRFAPTRLGRFHPSGLIDAKTLNNELDRLFLIAQDFELRQRYALHVNFHEENPQTTLPKKNARSQKLLGFNQQGGIAVFSKNNDISYAQITQSLTSSADDGTLASLEITSLQANTAILIKAHIALSLVGTLTDFPFYWSSSNNQKNRDGLSLIGQQGRSSILSLCTILPLENQKTESITIGWDFGSLTKPASWSLNRNPTNGDSADKSIIFATKI